MCPPALRFVLVLLFVVSSFGRMLVVGGSPLVQAENPLLARDGCVKPDPDNTLTDRMNIALNTSGPGYVLSLCPSTTYVIIAPIRFAYPNQEISTAGYPTGDERATLVVFGPVANGTGHTTAVDGTCPNCNGVKLRNIQINGTRNGHPPTNGGANIEMGGPNSDQVVEFVRSYDPRSWSCLHIAEGSINCNNVTVQNNDIGPCGSDNFKEWADGISFSCRNGLIRNNLVNDPTDGGVVLFGSPGTIVENNTIWIETQTLLGGINMVDVNPWSGNYTGVVVQNNLIVGGFASERPQSSSQTKGNNKFGAIIKIGIAIGPRTWFGDHYGTNVSSSGTVRNNRLTGGFGYGMAVSSARNFTVESNILMDNTSFIGKRGQNCSTVDNTPSTQAFIIDQATVEASTIQSDFQSIPDGDSLTCIVPPDGGDFWPFGGNSDEMNITSNAPLAGPPNTPISGNHSFTGKKVGLGVGVAAGLVFAGVLTWFVRRRAVTRRQNTKSGYGFEKRAGFIRRKF